MKTLVICISLLGTLIFNSGNSAFDRLTFNTYYQHQESKDSIYVEKDLPEYGTEACLGNLLAAVAKSNGKYYNPDKSFYAVILTNTKKYGRQLEVFVNQWHDAKNIRYVGLIKLGNATFLCAGDVERNSLLHKKASYKTRINIVFAKKPSALPIDVVEPSLQGTFNNCKGLPMYVEVYTSERIEGYHMRVIHGNAQIW